MKRFRTAIALAAAALLIVVPGALASVSDQIIRDARDGRIDGTYSQAQLRVALASPLLKTYGGDGGVEAVRSAIGSQSDPGAAAGTRNTLPFTGFEAGTFVVLGLSLVVFGFVLRRSGRTDQRA
jgi:hypothetical protein